MSKRRQPSKRLKRAYLKRWPSSLAAGAFREYNLRAQGIAVNEDKINERVINKLFDLEVLNARTASANRTDVDPIVEKDYRWKIIKEQIDTPIEYSIQVQRTLHTVVAFFFELGFHNCYFIRTDGIFIWKSWLYSSRELAYDALKRGTIAWKQPIPFYPGSLPLLTWVPP